jgi:hypothetical protein
VHARFRVRAFDWIEQLNAAAIPTRSLPAHFGPGRTPLEKSSANMRAKPWPSSVTASHSHDTLDFVEPSSSGDGLL